MTRQPDPLARFPLVFALVYALCVGPVALSTGCQSLYRSVVTITSLVDGASKTYATLYNRGLIPPETAAKVAKAHLAYREAAGVAEKALIAYKASGQKDKAAYDAAFAATLQAATEFIEMVIPFFTTHDVIALRTQLAKANSL